MCQVSVGVSAGLGTALLQVNGTGNDGTWGKEVDQQYLANESDAESMSTSYAGKHKERAGGSIDLKNPDADFDGEVNYIYDKHGKNYKDLTLTSSLDINLGDASDPYADAETDIIYGICKQRGSFRDALSDCTKGTERKAEYDVSGSETVSYDASTGAVRIVQPTTYTEYKLIEKHGELTEGKQLANGSGTWSYAGTVRQSSSAGTAAWSITGQGKDENKIATTVTTKTIDVKSHGK